MAKLTQAELNRRRAELKREYDKMPKTADRLAWCNQKARELGMSYGQFSVWIKGGEK